MNKSARICLLCTCFVLLIVGGTYPNTQKNISTKQDTAYRLLNIAFESFAAAIETDSLTDAENYLEYINCADPMNHFVGRLNIIFAFIKRDRSLTLALVDSFLLYHKFDLLLIPVNNTILINKLSSIISTWDMDGGLSSPADNMFLKGLVYYMTGKPEKAVQLWNDLLHAFPNYGRLRAFKVIANENSANMRMALFYDFYSPRKNLSRHLKNMSGGGFSIGGRLGSITIEGCIAGFSADANEKIIVDRFDGRLDTMYSTFGGNIGLNLRGAVAESHKWLIEIIFSSSFFSFEIVPLDTTPVKVYESVSSSYFSPAIGMGASYKRGRNGQIRIGLETFYSILQGGNKEYGLNNSSFVSFRVFASGIGNTRANTNNYRQPVFYVPLGTKK